MVGSNDVVNRAKGFWVWPKLGKGRRGRPRYSMATARLAMTSRVKRPDASVAPVQVCSRRNR